jgi:NAD(P)-dependent dehydrogenase (short-subunit alcohol dehydrogenase family)
MTEPNQIKGVALVTGAADRIGAAIAGRLASAGYRVVIHYRSQERNAEAVARQIAATGGEVAIVMADLAKRSDRATLIERASAPFGPLSVLVNNASTFEPDSAMDLDETLWDQHFAVHAEAPIFLARDFAAQLPKGAHGNIVNIIDERVLHLSPAYFSYTLSKSVLWTATRTLAQSLAPAIRVNAIGPGPTMKHKRQTEESFAQSVAALPLDYGAGPDDIADGVLVLLNTLSMTGQMLALDGGRHLEYGSTRGVTPRKK